MHEHKIYYCTSKIQRFSRRKERVKCYDSIVKTGIVCWAKCLLFIIESITLMVLELGENGHFSVRTCGVHRSGIKTWLGHANTVLIAFVYARTGDEASQRVCMMEEDGWCVLFIIKPTDFFSHVKATVRCTVICMYGIQWAQPVSETSQMYNRLKNRPQWDSN